MILLAGWGQRITADSRIPPHVDRALNRPPRRRELRMALTWFAAAERRGGAEAC